MQKDRRGKDFESNYLAMRRRMQTLGTAVIPAPATIGAHRHHASEVDVSPNDTTGGLMSADDVQEALEEHDVEKLARSGVQPMLGNLDMGDFAIFDVLNLTFMGGVGDAILNLVRKITMTGIGLIEQVRKVDFTGSAVGEGIIDQPRVIHLAGDDSDNEARIDGAERIVFNDEVTKSVIENPSTIEFNPAVTPGTDTTHTEGQVSWSDLEGAPQSDVAVTGMRLTKGWVELRWRAPIEIDEFLVVWSDQAVDNSPRANLFSRASWDPVNPWQLPSFAVSKHFEAGEGYLWVMQRGILRGIDVSGIGASVNDLLWATGASGAITNTRPTYQDAPYVLVGRLIAESGGIGDIEVDVRVFPLVHALPGHSWRRHFLMMGA